MWRQEEVQDRGQEDQRSPLLQQSHRALQAQAPDVAVNSGDEDEHTVGFFKLAAPLRP